MEVLTPAPGVLMKLNIGCGDRKVPGFMGVDAVQRKATDLVAPAWAIPLPDGSADEILAVHLWEHFYYWECSKVITEWKRLLVPGGRLVLELPNLRKCAENLIRGLTSKRHPDQLHMWGIYGDPRAEDPFMTHRWGWTPETLKAYLEANGFIKIQNTRPQFHPLGADVRDMRIEARKK